MIGLQQFVIVSSVILLVGAQYGVFTTPHDFLTDFTDKNITIKCQQDLQSGPAPSLGWQLNDETIANNTNKYFIEDVKDQDESLTTSTLTIINAQLQDAGTYTCVGIDSSASVVLTLVSSVSVTITSESGGFVLGAGTIIHCMVDGSSSDDIQWFKGNMRLTKGKHNIVGDSNDDLEVTEDNSIKFLSDDVELVGEYTCFKNLTTDAITANKSAVQVIGTNIDIDVPRSIKVSEGEDGEINCKATSKPLAEITFYHEGKLIDGSEEKYDIKSKQTLQENEVHKILIIKKVVEEDALSPNYTCTASNSVTEKSELVLLRIRDKLAALWPFIGIVSEVVILIVIILIHEACTKGEDIGEVDDDEEDHLLQKDRTITRDGERETRMRGTNN